MTSAPIDVHATIAERLRRGQTVEQLVAVGERTGWWTAEQVDQVADGPVTPAVAPSSMTRPRRRRSDRTVPAVGPVPVELLPPTLEAIAGFAGHQLAREARASAALDGETYAVGGADTAAEPRRDQTPTEGTPPGTVRAGDAGTAPEESGHGNAGPDAQPQVSPSRSRIGEGGGLGAWDAPVGPPATDAGGRSRAADIRARVDALLPRVHSDGSINAQFVAHEQTLRHNHGLPSYIPELDGPGRFRPAVNADGWVWDEASRSYVERTPAVAAGTTPRDDVVVPIEQPAPAPATPRRQVDLLAVGLEHQHPAVRAKAQIVVKAVDALLAAMDRHGRG